MTVSARELESRRRMIVEAEEKINIVQLLNCDIIISTADRGHTPHSSLHSWNCVRHCSNFVLSQARPPHSLLEYPDITNTGQ